MGALILRTWRMRVNAQMRKIQRLFNKRNHSGKAVRVLAKIAGKIRFATLKLRPGFSDLLAFAGNVDLKCRGDAVNQFGRNFVLAHDLDRLGQLDAALIDLETLRRKRLRYIARRHRTE